MLNKWVLERHQALTRNCVHPFVHVFMRVGGLCSDMPASVQTRLAHTWPHAYENGLRQCVPKYLGQYPLNYQTKSFALAGT